MTTYSFTLRLAREAEPAGWWDAFVAAVYPHAADSSAFRTGGKAYLHFDREAASLRDAVASAVRDARRADPKVSVRGIEVGDGQTLDAVIAGLDAA